MLNRDEIFSMKRHIPLHVLKVCKVKIQDLVHEIVAFSHLLLVFLPQLSSSTQPKHTKRYTTTLVSQLFSVWWT